ncbi:MAG: RNA-binding domain-containing protein, partial [Nanoarchaeota archaeon]
NDETIENKICKRIDENCKCYIRLDKESLFNGEYKLVFDGNCFHIKISLAVFPKRKKKAEELVKKTLNNSI